MGRERERPLRPDWEAVKDDIMRTAVRAKFTQHADLQQILLGTGNQEIVEHTTNDAYWGDGGDGSGANMLGKILMEIRAELVLDVGDFPAWVSGTSRSSKSSPRCSASPCSSRGTRRWRSSSAPRRPRSRACWGSMPRA